MSSEDESESDSIPDVLQNNLGLSSYECDVYLTLVNNGKQSMSNVAKSSGVPKHRVYDIAEKLREKGYIEIIDQYPKEAYAVPPKEVFQPVKKRINTVKDRLEDQYQTVDDIGGGIAMMKSQSTIEKFLTKIINNSNTDISLTLPYELLNSKEDIFSEAMGDLHVKTVVSNIPSRNIVNGKIKLKNIPEFVDEMYGIKSQEPFVISADRAQGFFWTGFESSSITPEMQGFYVTNQEFSLLFDRYILHSLLPRAEQIYKPSIPRPLPASYVRIHDCIEDLKQRKESKLTVHINGFSTTTREKIEFSGRLVDFHSGPDIVAYLEIIREEFDKKSSSARVGGWKATTLDDYEAREITISQPQID